MLRLWGERCCIFGGRDAASFVSKEVIATSFFNLLIFESLVSLWLTNGFNDVTHHEGREDLGVAGEAQSMKLLHQCGLHVNPPHELGSGGVLCKIGTIELCQLSLTVTPNCKHDTL